MRKQYIKVVIFQIILVCLFSSCKKLIDVEAPVTSTNAENVYTNDATAAAVLTGIYSNMSSSNISDAGITAMSFLPALSADELSLFNGVNNSKFLAYYTNALTSSNTGTDFWRSIYPVIFIANSAIEGLNNSPSLTASVKKQLIGEAKFIRAFCYFYLVNLYGDTPLALTTNYKINAQLARTPKAQVWQQIIVDLKDAQNILSSTYLAADIKTSTTERVRPTKWAATALLARAYLYTQKYDSAEAQATAVINNSTYNLNTLSNVFKKSSNIEAIWELQPVTTTPSNTWEGFLFVLPAGGPNTSNYPVYLSNNLLNSFETGDQRKINWIGSVTPTPPGTTTYYYANKYKIGAGTFPVSEYSIVLRLAEQYLIRAEARAQQNNISGAQADLNVIRTRAGLGNTTATTTTALLAAILQERRIELFTEWGHRWLDLKRTGNIDAVMNIVTPQKGGTWSSNWQWYPIPLNDLLSGPNLIQNTGY